MGICQMLSRCSSSHTKHPLLGLFARRGCLCVQPMCYTCCTMCLQAPTSSFTDTSSLMQHLNAQLPADKRSTFDSWGSLSTSIRAVPAGRPITPPPGMPPLARVPHRVQHGHNSDGRTRRNQRVVHNDLYTVSSMLMPECVTCTFSCLLPAVGYLHALGIAAYTLDCSHVPTRPGVKHKRHCMLSLLQCHS